MAKLQNSFLELLKEIEPDPEAVGLAIKAHDPVREFLENDTEFAKNFKKTFLYGSYKRETAVGDIKDVDIVVLTDFDPKDCEPITALRKLKLALSKHYKNPDMLEYQRRSIRVDQPLPSKKSLLTLDVIPAIATDGEDNPLLVPDRESKVWVQSHPKGHLKHTTLLNDENHSDGMFVPLVKLMKWWWKYQCKIKMPKVERPKPKGFWVECLTGELFDPKLETYAEHFTHVLENIVDEFDLSDSIPDLDDPGLPGQKIKTNMTIEEYKVFVDIARESLKYATEALQSDNERDAASSWRKIFGVGFPVPTLAEQLARFFVQPRRQDEYFASTEEFLEDRGITYKNGGHRFKVEAFIEQDGFRPFQLILGSFIKKSCKITFRVAQNEVPMHHTIYWKIKNTGEEARRLGQLRGQIHTDGGSGQRIENSLYTGNHYVECYAVDENNVCVAMDRIDVKIP